MNTATSQELTDAQYDMADAIELWLESHPGFYSASKIAQGIKSDTYSTKVVLEWMEQSMFVAATGNGAWKNWGAR